MRLSAILRRTRTFRSRLLLWHAVAILGVLLALGIVLDRVMEGLFVDQLTDGLVKNAQVVQAAVADDQEGLQAHVVALGVSSGVRITIIATDGVVLADSESDPATMENHLGRPEIQRALAGRVGTSSRLSSTIGLPFRYVALPPAGGRIVRVALPLTEVRSKLETVRAILVAGFGLAAVAGVTALAVVARGLTRPLTRVSEAVDRAARGELTDDMPETGTAEMVVLARSVNRMRREIASRIDSIERDRRSREAILAALEEGIVLFDGSNEVLYSNPRAEELVGPPAATRAILARPGDLRQAIERARDLQATHTVEAPMGPAPRTVRATALPVPGDGHVLLVLRDVTEAMRLEAIRRDLVANASHELKTPVASVQALAETISSAAAHDPEAVAAFATTLEREAQRLARVVSDLLDLSRLEGGSEERSEVRLDRLVADEAGRVRERAEGAGLTLSVVDEGPLVVAGSERDLGLLVRNLLENAIQYTPTGGRVATTLSTEDGHARLTVADTGIGIPTRDQGRVFERFYRVDRARSRETGGTGLGLSIVKHVAENHGGSVAVDSELGRGSTFTVRLPLPGTD